MKRFGLTKKILLVLFLMFAAVFFVIYIGMSRYFEPYYARKQTSEIEKQVKSYLKIKNVQSDTNKIELKKIVEEFSENNANPIFIVKNGMEVSPARRFSIYLDYGGEKILVEVDRAAFQLQNLDAMIEKGMSISLYGFWSDELFIGLSIYELTERNLQKLKDTYGNRKEIVKLTGRVIDYDFPKYEKGSIYKQDKIYELIKSDTWQKEIKYGDTAIIEKVDVVTDIKNFYIIIPYNELLIFTAHSLQPFKSVISAIPEFLKLIILFTMLVFGVIIICMVNIVLRPVFKINEVALKISNLDFSDRIIVRTSDEINMISKSVNTMADKLEDALNRLESQNKLLKYELTKKEIFEESRKRFVADVSHELKTPLSIVRAYTERLEDKHVSDEKGIQCINIIKDENKKMNKLINDLLELSKLESKRDILKKDRYNLSAEITEIIERFSHVFKERELRLNFIVNEKLEVFADIDRMNQVFTNMISNALKYSPRGSTVSIKLHKENDNIKFAISNILVDKKKIELSKVWDRFYKADKARSRKLGGSGLGLAISKRIIQLHGFQFDVVIAKDIITFIVEMR